MVSTSLVCNHPFVKQVESGAFRHFPDYHTGFPYRVWLLEHLPAAERVRCRLIGFYKFHRARLPSPGMVYQQLCIDAKQAIQHLLVPDGLPCDVSHRVDAVLLQFAGYAFSHTPEIRQRSVRPRLSCGMSSHPVPLCAHRPCPLGYAWPRCPLLLCRGTDWCQSLRLP